MLEVCFQLREETTTIFLAENRFRITDAELQLSHAQWFLRWANALGVRNLIKLVIHFKLEIDWQKLRHEISDDVLHPARAAILKAQTFPPTAKQLAFELMQETGPLSSIVLEKLSEIPRKGNSYFNKIVLDAMNRFFAEEVKRNIYSISTAGITRRKVVLIERSVADD